MSAAPSLQAAAAADEPYGLKFGPLRMRVGVERKQTMTSLVSSQEVERQAAQQYSQVLAALTAAGVVGSVTYPALMGVISEMAGLELTVIDAGTKLREFKQQLRWNEVYYGLNQGFRA